MPLTEANRRFFKDVLVEQVTAAGPIKATKLVAAVITRIYAAHAAPDDAFLARVRQQNLMVTESVDYPALLGELVAAGEILEVEYVLPASDDRVKSLFFPKGSEIRLLRAAEA